MKDRDAKIILKDIPAGKLRVAYARAIPYSQFGEFKRWANKNPALTLKSALRSVPQWAWIKDILYATLYDSPYYAALTTIYRKAVSEAMSTYKRAIMQEQEVYKKDHPRKTIPGDHPKIVTARKIMLTSIREALLERIEWID